MHKLSSERFDAAHVEHDLNNGHYRVAHYAARLSALMKHFIELRMREAGVTDIAGAHGDVLAVLFARSQVTMSEIARFSDRTKATITVLVARLETLGYVRRRSNENDARSSLVELTEKGEALRTLFESISNELDRALVEALGRRQCELLESALARTVDRFESL